VRAAAAAAAVSLPRPAPEEVGGPLPAVGRMLAGDDGAAELVGCDGAVAAEPEAPNIGNGMAG